MEFVQLVKKTDFDFERLLAVQDCWIMLLDKDLKVRDSNDLCRSFLGFGVEEFRGRRLDGVLSLGHLVSLMEQGVCFRSQPIPFGERKLICHFVPRLEDGELLGGVLAIEPQAVAWDDLGFIELQDIVRTLGSIMDVAYEGTIIIDDKGKVVLVNQAFADLLGTRAQDMVGKHVLKAYPNSKLSRLPIVMQTGKSEVGWPHMLNGREIIACRYPLIKNGKAIGALGKVLIQDVQEVLRLANESNGPPARPAQSPPQVAKVGEFKYDIGSIIGHSKVMKVLKEKLLRVAERSSNVLLIGESGTGKELFAHSIHAASKRRYGPFIKMNCAAIPEHLLESELFGYVDGAFTGAKRGGQIGKFELAHGGTIFLDEISDMSLPMQAKLLRILQEKELTPLGSNSAKCVDVRIIAATNVKLEEAVAGGKFREDLYYRLNVMALAIPPLRERTEDIYFIVNHFIETFNPEFGLDVKGLAPEAWELVKSYQYPGNIRELRNLIESAFNVVVGPYISREDLPQHVHQVSGVFQDPAQQRGESGFLAEVGTKGLQQIMEGVEQQVLERSLEQAGGNKLRAAALLGISRPGFYKKLQKYRLV